MHDNKIGGSVATLKAMALIAALFSNPAPAAILGYTFDFNVSGPESAGGPYTGTFSFDDAGLDLDPLAGFAYALSAFDFTFAGNSYTLLNDPLAQAHYGWDMQFLGITYSATLPGAGGNLITFSAGLPGLPPVFPFPGIPSDPSTAGFTYDIGSNGQDGSNSGVIVYAESAPEPGLLIPSLFGALLGGVALRRRRGRSSANEAPPV